MNQVFQHLPVLIIAVPLTAAPFVVLFRNSFLSWLISVVVSWFCLFSATTLLGNIYEGGEVPIYQLGGWDGHVGIVYQVDIVNSFVLTLVTAISAVVFV